MGNNNAMTAEHFDRCSPTSSPTPRTRRCSRRTYTAARILNLRAARARLHRIRLALAVHPQSADPSAARESSTLRPELTIVDLPSFAPIPKRHGARTETIIACDFTRKHRADRRHQLRRRDEEVGVHLSQLRAAQANVLPMHCSAKSAGPATTAIFFGLSGTGKTTLSADRSRTLIGDDEHGWSREAMFNFEGGCYAKAIRLSREAEPEIYAASERFGTVMENVVLDPRHPRARLRRRFPHREHAHRLSARLHRQRVDVGPRRPAAATSSCSTCDAFGVLPPIAKLDAEQAMYHFLSGYTAKVAGTGTRRHRAAGDLLDLLRRAVHAAPSDRLRQPAARV